MAEAHAPSRGARRRSLAVRGLHDHEHSTLTSARAAITAEAMGRMTGFLATLSGVLIAFGFVIQAAGFGRVALHFGAASFGGLFVLGLLTFVRMAQGTAEDLRAIERINQIRKFYLEVAPGLAPYLAPPAASPDRPAVMRAFGFRPRALQRMLTAAGTVLVLSAVIVGCAAGFLVAAQLGVSAGIAAGFGVGGVALVVLERTMTRVFVGA